MARKPCFTVQKQLQKVWQVTGYYNTRTPQTHAQKKDKKTRHQIDISKILHLLISYESF